MKIKMLKTALGAEDGINVREYIAGDVYVTHVDLATAFINNGDAELLETAAEVKQDDTVSPENKMDEPVKENKKAAKKTK